MLSAFGGEIVAELMSERDLLVNVEPVDLGQDSAELADHSGERGVDTTRALATGELAFHRLDEPVAGIAEGVEPGAFLGHLGHVHHPKIKPHR